MSRLRPVFVVALALFPVLGAHPVLASSAKPHGAKTRAAAMTLTAAPSPSPAATPAGSSTLASVSARPAPPPAQPAPILIAAPASAGLAAPAAPPQTIVEIRPGDPARVILSTAAAPPGPALTPLATVGLGSVPGLAGLLAALLVLRVRRRDEEALYRDELTGVLRRGAGLAAAARELDRARRHGEPLTAAFIDVDGLKRVNDSRGHAAGDQLLRAVAAALSSRLRGEDLILRYGGDEFVCLLPGASAAKALPLLASVRDGVAARAGFGFSFGVAELRPGERLEALLSRADAELYRERSLRRAAR